MGKKKNNILILEKTDFFSSLCPTYAKDSLGLPIIVLCSGFEVGLGGWHMDICAQGI